MLLLRRRGEIVRGGASAFQPSQATTITLSTGAVVRILCRRRTPGELTQSTGADQPTFEAGVIPGRSVVKATGTQHLLGDFSDKQLVTLMVAWVPSVDLTSERPLLTRDTSQAGTTKPAFEILTRQA